MSERIRQGQLPVLVSPSVTFLFNPLFIAGSERLSTFIDS